MLMSLVVHVARFAGAVAAIWGVAYPLNGATQAPGPVAIRVTSVDQLGLTGVKLPPGVTLHGHELSLDVWDSTVAEQVLARGEVLLSGLSAGAAALLLALAVALRVAAAHPGAGPSAEARTNISGEADTP